MSDGIDGSSRWAPTRGSRGPHAPTLGTPATEPRLDVTHFRHVCGISAIACSRKKAFEPQLTRTVAILCFERDHDRCHRQVVADRVSERVPAERAVIYA